MTDLNSTPQEEGQIKDSFEKLDIAELRRFAKLIGITSQRDWTKADYVTALKANQRDEHKANVAIDGSKAPAPGYARILIHRDPTPNHKNNPVHVALNGHLFGIPRGVAVDVPIPFVEILANAKTTAVLQESDGNHANPAGSYRDEAQTSYPFQVQAITPGAYKNPYDNREKAYAIRKQFHEKHGVWPTGGELAEFRKTIK